MENSGSKKLIDTFLGEYLPDILRATEEEIYAINKDQKKEFNVYEGHLIHEFTDFFLYSFKVDTDVNLEPDSPVNLRISEDDKVPGQFKAAEDFTIFLSIEEHVGEFIDNARVISNPAFIYEKLFNRLREESEAEACDLSIQHALLANASPVYKDTEEEIEEIIRALQMEPVDDENQTLVLSEEDHNELASSKFNPNEQQRKAIKKCLEGCLHFVWGPPGTGKTANLSQVVRALNQKKEKTLVLAHSNAAIDVAMMRIANVFEGSTELACGKLIRVGIPHKKELLGYKEVIPDEIIRQEYPDLVTTKEELKQQKKKLGGKIKKIKSKQKKEIWAKQFRKVIDKLKAINKTLKEIQTKLIEDAQVVGATLSRFIIDDRVYGCKFSNIIIDEASMATFPTVLLASLRAKERLLLFGDYMQLPPIFLSKSQLVEWWYGRNAFQISGVEGKTNDERLTMLKKQYRMNPHICGLVSHLAYKNQLNTAREIIPETEEIAKFNPFPEKSLIFVNTEAINPLCYKQIQGVGYSRFNPLQAGLASTLAFDAIDSGCSKVAIISPYCLQALIINKMVIDEVKTEKVAAATVHKFQGSERDVVIFDLTDAPKQEGPSMLTGKYEKTALQLLNVAFSRSKGKLIILGDGGFIERRFPEVSPIRKAFNYVKKNGHVVDIQPQDLVSKSGDFIKWYKDFSSAVPSLLKDLKSSNRKIHMNIPETYLFDVDVLAMLREILGIGDMLNLFIPYSAAEEVEKSSVRTHFINVSDSFLSFRQLLLGYIGSSDPGKPVFSSDNSEFLEFISKEFFGVKLFLPLMDPERNQKIEALWGGCPVCRQRRKPLKDGSSKWILCCENFCEAGAYVDNQILQEFVDILDIKCEVCDADVVVRSRGKRFFLSCPNFNRSCKGYVPKIDDLLGGLI